MPAYQLLSLTFQPSAPKLGPRRAKEAIVATTVLREAAMKVAIGAPGEKGGGDTVLPRRCHIGYNHIFHIVPEIFVIVTLPL